MKTTILLLLKFFLNSVVSIHLKFHIGSAIISFSEYFMSLFIEQKI